MKGFVVIYSDIGVPCTYRTSNYMTTYVEDITDAKREALAWIENEGKILQDIVSYDSDETTGYDAYNNWLMREEDLQT